jgi:putative addiction module component (TIGR02574 family)
MHSRLGELRNLPLSERAQLLEDLWGSIAADLEGAPIPASIRVEMDERLAAYLADPSRSLSLEDVQHRMKAGA